jgi:hypothetical protein
LVLGPPASDFLVQLSNLLPVQLSSLLPSGSNDQRPLPVRPSHHLMI